MEDKNEQIYSQYKLDIKNIYKKRGFIYIEEKDNLYIIKPYNYTEKKAETENVIKNILVERGYKDIDVLIKNNFDTYLSQNKYGNKFVLKKWFLAEECDINNIESIKKASSNLAQLHNIMVNMVFESEEEMYIPKKNVLKDYEAYNKELKRVKKYINNKKKKNRLEIEILKNIDIYYKEAEYYYNKLKNSNYQLLYDMAIKEHNICHGNYTHHSVLISDNCVATINFDKIAYGVHIYDLYCLLRKVMEKNDWNINIGLQLIEAYNDTKMLSEDEKEILRIFIAYPDKFRKLINSYYNGKKSLISIRISEKLNELVNNEIKKKDFLSELKKI